MHKQNMEKNIKTKKWKIVVRTLAFLAILTLIVFGIGRVLDLSSSKRYEVWTDYYDEPAGTLDAVFVGASNVYNFWMAPTCWKEYGYTVFPLALPSMHVDFMPYVIEEARKTNPDVLYIICLNSLKSAEKMDVSRLHNTIDYMHLSANKSGLITNMTEQMGISGLDRLEFYLPLIRFHDRWAELTADDFDFSTDELKAASVHKNFLSKRKNVTKEYVTTDRKVRLSEKQETSLNTLLDYCDDKSVNALFVVNPQPLKTEEVAGQFNTIEEAVVERGYPVLNMLDKTDEMGLCLTTDFYDYLHTNIHGALKYTRYLSAYLKENYYFQDKRESDGYGSWDNAVEKYRAIMDSCLLDFEQNNSNRYSTKPVSLTSIDVQDDRIALTWNDIQDAWKYALYRQENGGTWELIAYLDAQTDSYEDRELELSGSCRYAVVPVSGDGDSRSYGNFVISKEIDVQVEEEK